MKKEYLFPESKSAVENKNCTGSVDEKRVVAMSNGVRMPLLGLGTTHSSGYSHDAVVYALRECGYRSIDTAKRYGVEEQLGKAIKESGVPRGDLFLTTKLWPVDFGASTSEALKQSCKRLGTDYVDLYLLHFAEVPNWFERKPRAVREETWRALENLYEAGKCRAIGVSNFLQADLEEMLEYCSVRPHANQFEFHPYYNDVQLRSFCREENILFAGYCPLAKGSILNEEPVLRIAEKVQRTPAQVCIRWSVQQKVPAIPKSLKFERLRENMNVFDFEIDTADMDVLNKLHDPNRKCVALDDLQKKFTLPDGYKLSKG